MPEQRGRTLETSPADGFLQPAFPFSDSRYPQERKTVVVIQFIENQLSQEKFSGQKRLMFYNYLQKFRKNQGEEKFLKGVG
jgi:hypothetical protein